MQEKGLKILSNTVKIFNYADFMDMENSSGQVERLTMEPFSMGSWKETERFTMHTVKQGDRNHRMFVYGLHGKRTLQ